MLHEGGCITGGCILSLGDVLPVPLVYFLPGGAVLPVVADVEEYRYATEHKFGYVVLESHGTCVHVAGTDAAESVELIFVDHHLCRNG